MENKTEDNNEYHFFVAHEFSTENIDDLRDAIENAFRGSGLKPYYADVEVRQTHILEKIKEKIFNTQFGIYDISNPNKPNVFLELGIAIAAEKIIFLVCRRGTNIPADLDGLDRIEYESKKQLTNKLRTFIVEGFIQQYKIGENVFTDEDVSKGLIKSYQAEEAPFHHPYGQEDIDFEASNHKAWYGDNNAPCPIHLLYGPYHDLPESGKYRVFFRVKIDKNTDIKEVLHLDVFSNKNHRINSQLFIRGLQFVKPMEYQIFGIDFEYHEENDLEYRVIKLVQNRKVWIDYISISKII